MRELLFKKINKVKIINKNFSDSIGIKKYFIDLKKLNKFIDVFNFKINIKMWFFL
tara:strand:- start:346 stop:510 length:165 start_codon:yes stop_codon:yes gene_type:complete